ncbi:MAG: hypothetical protein MUF59_01520 [Candidatus Krumholzibacteria bacterium]|nr:hypothetical protein [Candidatus Krumholzibacteria bacterium]
MADDLKLSLGPVRPEKRGGKAVIVLLAAVAVLAAANLALSIFGGPSTNGTGDGLSAAKLEELALKLEGRQLHGAAAAAWTDYLGAASLPRAERAAIWYRIGKLRQDGGDFEGALDAYYRSEAIEELKETAPDIGMRVSECLERLGKFSALRSELEGRTAVDRGAAGSGEVLAEIGAWKIDRPELHRMIEAEIGAQLSSVAGSLAPGRLAEEKDKLLDEALKKGGEEEWLARFVAEELLYRMAMDGRVYDSPEYRELARNVERKLLVQKALDKEYAAKITITEEELRAFYESDKARFGEGGESKDFSEVSSQVYAALRARKEAEVQSALIEELRQKYDAVIHRSAGQAGGGRD